jgi:folate-dependent phosphoribosylglycinamide formyltransferase PurN
MSVVLLTNNSNRGQALAHLIIREGLDLKLVVVEDPALKQTSGGSQGAAVRKLLGPSYRWLRSMVKLSNAERQALRYEEESIAKANKLVDDFISELGVNGRPNGIEYLETPSLNEATVVTAVKNAQPDVCVVLGTSIIRQRIIDIPKMGMINAHTSILPEYRGSRSEFWQCYNEDYRNVGITLHFVDKGVDTGKILFQLRQDVGINPDPNLLRANNTLATLKNYVPVIRSVLEGTANPTVQGQGTTPTYKFRDITEEKRIKLYQRFVTKLD